MATSKQETIWTDDYHNTDLTFDYSNVAHFVRDTKPETRVEKLAFIHDFERRGGFNYWPRESSLRLLNVHTK